MMFLITLWVVLLVSLIDFFAALLKISAPEKAVKPVVVRLKNTSRGWRR